jgi:hypothetical protein
MIESWWFRLYTRPFLKRVVLLFSLAVVADLILTSMGHWANNYVYFLPVLALPMKNRPDSFRANLEFHKMHVAFSELRKAFLTDIFFTCISFLLLYSLVILISTLGGGLFSTPAIHSFLNLTPSLMLYLTSILLILITWICILDIKKKYIFRVAKSRSFFRNTFLYCLIGLACFILFIILGGGLGFMLKACLAFIIASRVIASVVFFVKAIFHQSPPHATLGSWFKHVTIGGFAMSVLFISCLLLGRNDVLNQKLANASRINSFEFFGILNPVLDIEAFKIIEPSQDSLRGGFVYSNLDFDPSALGLFYFLSDDEDTKRLTNFLQDGKPSTVFLESLLEHMSENPQTWTKESSAEYVRNLAFKRWPSETPIPDKYLAEKKKSDDFAELRKHKREVASGSEDVDIVGIEMIFE